MLLIKNWEGEAPTLVWEGAAHPILQGGMEPPLAKLSITKGVAPKPTLLARLSFPLLLPGQTHGSRSLVVFTSAGNAEALTPAATSTTHTKGFTVPYQTPK